MINQDSAFSLIDEITYSIVDVYGISGFEPIERSEISSTDITAYSSFIGNYQHEDDELIISCRARKLYITFSYGQEMELHQEQDNVFFIQECSDTVKLINSQQDSPKIHIISRGHETVYKFLSPG